MAISKSIKIVFYTAILVFTVASCSKEDTDVLSEEEAVALIETSLQSSTGGLNEITITYSEELTTDITLNEVCNTVYEKSFPFTFNGNFVDVAYNFGWSYVMNCTEFNIPESVEFTATSSGTYATQRINGNDASETFFNISGLQLSSATYLFNGSFKREGNQQITIKQNTRNINSFLDAQIINLTVNKLNNKIISGEGTITLTGNTNQNLFSYEASIIFNDNETATLSLNGNTYQIDLI